MRIPISVFSGIAVVSLLVGCQSRASKVNALQAEYDRLGQQYRQDCSAELVNVPPKLSPKCADENQKVEQAWNRLQAERRKQ
jgi:hypothetical protein